MNQKFLDVIGHEGPTTIVTINGNPAHVVNTWNSYLDVVDDHTILLPAAGMRSIEHDFAKDNHITLTMGSKAVPGTQGPGAGFHVHGTGQFMDHGAYYDTMKAKFEWMRKVLVVSIDDIQQKI